MAKNFNIRRSLASYGQNIVDGKERLFFLLQKNNLADEKKITDIIDELSTTSLANIQSLVDRTETSVQIYEMLLDILKNEKKRKEVQPTVNTTCILCCFYEQNLYCSANDPR